jgi:hypothetical protein
MAALPNPSGREFNMRFTKIVTALAAGAMTVSPTLAASPASKLSISGVAGQRASTVAGESNEAVSGFLIPAIAILAVIGGVLLITDDSDSD